MQYLRRFVVICCLALATDAARAADGFRLVEGDRIVLVGNTLIEREQRYGYWETALTRRYPDRSITFRNLGWSGDTVFGDARAGFGTQVDGFHHLKDHVLALKPTVIFIGYGTNESFEGPKGLPRFVKGLETLLDAFAPTKARIVLLAPLKQENLGPPLPNPKEQNKNLRLYADAIRDVAKKRDHLFVDLYELLGQEKHPLTENGIHLTAWGYWRSAMVLERGLGLADASWSIERKKDGHVAARGARVEAKNEGTLRFRITDDMLPLPRPPWDGMPKDPLADKQRFFRVEGLPPGSYSLRIDDGEPFSISADDGAFGLYLHSGPEWAQAERLRQAIIAKNRLYFHRWRPQNETYLFGFRKQEQGQNAREIPKFDPLVAEKEKEIAKLRVPVAHTYELKAAKSN